MKNPWLDRIEKKKAVKEINYILATFAQRKVSDLAVFVDDLRKVVRLYFKFRQHLLPLFAGPDGRIAYRFVIEERAGVVTGIKFEEK